MAILKTKDIQKMDESQQKEKLSELKMELVKANVTANKANAKTKEIKRAISRLFAMENQKLDKPSKKEEAITL